VLVYFLTVECSPANEFMDGLVNVDPELGRCLEERPANFVGVGHTLLGGHLSLTLEITLVPTYHLQIVVSR
jgi:hypothetical protein